MASSWECSLPTNVCCVVSEYLPFQEAATFLKAANGGSLEGSVSSGLPQAVVGMMLQAGYEEKTTRRGTQKYRADLLLNKLAGPTCPCESCVTSSVGTWGRAGFTDDETLFCWICFHAKYHASLIRSDEMADSCGLSYLPKYFRDRLDRMPSGYFWKPSFKQLLVDWKEGRRVRAEKKRKREEAKTRREVKRKKQKK